MKYNIERELQKRGCEVVTIPALTPPEEVVGRFDGVMLSNGPGDPAENVEIIANLKKLLKAISRSSASARATSFELGHRQAACKLRYGHRGVNHPVKDPDADRTLSPVKTTATRLWAEASIRRSPACAMSTLTTARSRAWSTSAGRCLPCEYHPEVCPGPMDTSYLFDKFIKHRKGERGRSVMPLRKDIHKVMVIGSGPIVIGQAAEFDYAGTQACRALRRKAWRCAGQLQPRHHHDRQRHGGQDLHRAPDRGRPSADHQEGEAGQPAFHLGRPDRPEPLHAAGQGRLLRGDGVKLLGAKPETIDKAEDRQMFKDTMESIGQPCIPPKVVNTVEGAGGFRR